MRCYLVMHESYQQDGKYLTFKIKPDQNWLSTPYSMKLARFADLVILCDDQGEPRYVKNRYENIKTAKIDTNEFAWIKLSSTEIGEI